DRRSPRLQSRQPMLLQDSLPRPMGRLPGNRRRDFLATCYRTRPHPRTPCRFSHPLPTETWTITHL
ncbi:hypothetical protein L208DRAFT_1478876, partial [Tricholoma matsutake]